MSSAVITHSHLIAKNEAVKIWSICGSQYINNKDVLDLLEIHLQESISSFSLNARRVIESMGKSYKFSTQQGCWSRSENMINENVENDLWNCLNSIIHAKKFEIIFEHLPDQYSYIAEDNKVISFIKVSTDRRENVYIDPFSMAYSYMSQVQFQFNETNRT